MPIPADGADLTFILRDAGTPARTAGGRTFYGILNLAQTVGGGDGLALERAATSFLCAAVDLEKYGVAYESRLTIDRKSWEVRDLVPQDDGATTLLILSGVTA